MKSAHAITTPAMDTESGNYTITAMGIRFHGELSVEEWNALGERLGSAGRSLGFMVGDWLLYGEGRAQEQKWGQSVYDNAMRITGLDYGTLRNYASVAKKLNLSLRSDKLSFDHHRKVAALKTDEEKRKWLSIAESVRNKQDGKPMSARRLAKSILKGEVIDEASLTLPKEDRGQDNVHPHVNRLVVFWGKMKRKGWLEDSEDLQLQRLMRDLEPVAKIYDEIADALEARKPSGNSRVDSAA